MQVSRARASYASGGRRTESDRYVKERYKECASSHTSAICQRRYLLKQPNSAGTTMTLLYIHLTRASTAQGTHRRTTKAKTRPTAICQSILKPCSSRWEKLLLKMLRVNDLH